MRGRVWVVGRVTCHAQPHLSLSQRVIVSAAKRWLAGWNIVPPLARQKLLTAIAIYLHGCAWETVACLYGCWSNWGEKTAGRYLPTDDSSHKAHWVATIPFTGLATIDKCKWRDGDRQLTRVLLPVQHLFTRNSYSNIDVQQAFTCNRYLWTGDREYKGWSVSERFWESPKESNKVWKPVKVFDNIVCFTKSRKIQGFYCQISWDRDLSPIPGCRSHYTTLSWQMQMVRWERLPRVSFKCETSQRHATCM